MDETSSRSGECYCVWLAGVFPFHFAETFIQSDIQSTYTVHTESTAEVHCSNSIWVVRVKEQSVFTRHSRRVVYSRSGNWPHLNLGTGSVGRGRGVNE